MGDLVEFVQKHMAQARTRLGKAKSGCSFAYFNSSVQQFKMQASRYDLIWCQWLLMYLTDADALEVLKRAGGSLAQGGQLVVKENVSTPEKATYFDDEDGELWEDGDVSS